MPGTPTLRTVLVEYAALEHVIQGLLNRYGYTCCSRCENVCCRYDICEESTVSAFLTLLRALYPPEADYDEKYGWHTADGCALRTGRPPVCYEFFCDDWLAAQASDAVRQAIKALGMLLTQVGRRALGQRHLVTMSDPLLLSRVSPERLMKKIQRAREELERLEAILHDAE